MRDKKKQTKKHIHTNKEDKRNEREREEKRNKCDEEGTR